MALYLSDCPTGRSRTPSHDGTSWRFCLSDTPPAASRHRSINPPADPADAAWAADLKMQPGAISISDTILSPFLAHSQPPCLAQIGSYKPNHHIGQIERQQLGKFLFRIGRAPPALCRTLSGRSPQRPAPDHAALPARKDAWFFQHRCRIFLERCAQGIRVLCLEVDQIPGRCAGQVFLDGVVNVIPLSISVKILDAGFLDLHIGHATVLPYQPFHGLLALRSVLVVLPQEKLHYRAAGCGQTVLWSRWQG